VHMRCEIIALASNKQLLNMGLDSAVDTHQSLDQTKLILFNSTQEENDIIKVTFDVVGSLWKNKQIIFEMHPNHITYKVEVSGDGEAITDLNFLFGRKQTKNSTDFDAVYAPRFDWFEGAVLVDPESDDTLGCQQWLSPPPFAYAFVNDHEAVYCGIAAEVGTYNFLSFDYIGSRGASFRLTYEGHTAVSGTFSSPKLVIGFGNHEKNDAIESYINYLRRHEYLPLEQPKEIPDWWHEPIFCGWGQMRYDYRFDHDGHENGNFINVTFYCTEQLYRNYIASMEANDIDPGTIIIDMGWAQDPALHTPSPKRWSDMRGFIDEQHAKGRKVLLWYTPVVTQGLPDEACMTLSGRPICPDPTSPVYREILAEEIRWMISDEDGCLNADGFKIDFTQNTPSESGRFIGYINNFWGLINESNEKYLYPPLSDREELIQTHGNKWGVEILREYISLLHTNMKLHKPDSMLITHTPNPYFTDIVDVLRLNDLDGECQDVLGVMQNRARIAQMCAQNWLLDTDNDLMVDKARWRAYIQLQPQLGIPDTYYASAIANSQEEFNEGDYALLRKVWAEYRESLRPKEHLHSSAD
ncbi:MAG: TIM-barrel domain-containing protein, partial [Chloroflexota bacterium]